MKELIKKYLLPTIVIITLIGIFTLGFRSCNDAEYITDLKKQKENVEAKYATLKVEYNKKDSVYNYYKQGYVGLQEDVKILKEDNLELYNLAKGKDVKTASIVGTKFILDTVTKVVEVKVDVSGNEVRKSTIVRPEYVADITSYKDSTKLELEALTKLNITVDSKGVLKVTPSNRFLQVTELSGYTKVDKPKKSYKWLWFGAGLVAGGFGAYKLVK